MTDGPLFDQDADPVDRSRELGRQLLAIPADQVFTKRAVMIGFGVVLAALGVVLAVLVTFTSGTRRAVQSEIPALEDQVSDRDATIATQEDLLGQAVDAIVLLQGDLRALGVEPREVVIRATTTTTTPS